MTLAQRKRLLMKASPWLLLVCVFLKHFALEPP